MAPRQSRSSISVVKPKIARKKATKRSLDAFAIASAEHPENPRVARHRLGEIDHSGPSRKRQRLDEDEELEGGDSDEEEGGRPAKSRRRKAEVNSSDEGSDSEGNNWTLGHVDEDDDSELDSDEAFGESDEERFEGWTFKASKSGKKGKQPGARAGVGIDIDLNEEESEDEDSDGSLGEDAVDLATMLDQNSEDEDEPAQPTRSKQGKGAGSFDAESDDDESMEEADDASHYSASDDEDNEDGPRQQLQMNDLLSSLAPKEIEAVRKKTGYDALESRAPEDAEASRQKLDLSALLPSGTSAKHQKDAKLFQDDLKSTKRNRIPAKAEVPLPKRQQDRLDRIEANTKTKETLERWVDTVKQNRRAEHISFPLQYADAAEPMGTKKLLSSVVPQNSLESTIQNILQQSGLAAVAGGDEEDRLRKFEELETKHLPVEEVEARRAELRKARELLFREEVRAKRIKKIKSKSYRRVHRKERERMAEKERAALLADGVDLEEEDREANDRRRAEERMGAKHRSSKWSKGVKQSGRAAWDEDARAGVTEMARRNEELRRRIQGKDGVDDSDVSSGDSDMDEDADGQKLTRQLSRVEGQDAFEGAGSRLASMAFMRKADAARKAQNDEEVQRMQRELAGEDTPSDYSGDEVRQSGRRIYGPSAQVAINGNPKATRNDFEERDDSDDNLDTPRTGENGDGREARVQSSRNQTRLRPSKQEKHQGILRNGATISSLDEEQTAAPNPWLSAPAKKGRKTHQVEVAVDAEFDKSPKKDPKRRSSGAEIVSAPDADGWQTVTYSKDNNEDQSSDEGEDLTPFVIQNKDLMQKVFAGDDVMADFERERKEIADLEDEKIIDETLPGWGSWAGEGLTKREQKRNVGKVLRKQDGIRPQDRKDAKLAKVIINEKRNRKNAKYMATQLPFPFESTQQYERSLRLATGPEWSTKQAFQDATKPRVLVKQGVILPPERPMA